MRSADNKQQTASGHAAFITPLAAILIKRQIGLFSLGNWAAEQGSLAERPLENGRGGAATGGAPGPGKPGAGRKPGEGLNCTNCHI
jgi:hypothetical protein